MKNVSLSILLFIAFIPFGNGQNLRNPSFEEVLSLQSSGRPILSPDGNNVVYNVNSTDWENNRYDSELWLSKNNGAPFQLTNTLKGSSSNPKWSPDGKWIAFMASREDKSQIYVLRLEGGEAIRITNEKDGINSYEWSPDGNQIAFVKTPPSKDEKPREDRYGKFAVEDKEYNLSTLWLMNFRPSELYKSELPEYTKDSINKVAEKPVALIDSGTFTISGFQWSPDGKTIAINHQPNPDILSFMKSDISLLDVQSKKISPLVKNPSSDGLVAWSPDGKSILYESNLNDSISNFYKNDQLFVINADGSGNRRLAVDFDENFGGLEWAPTGIYTSALEKTKSAIFRIDDKSGKVQKLTIKLDRVYGFSLNKAGTLLSFAGENTDQLPEIYTCPIANLQLKKISSFNDQIKDWKIAKSEVISWQSTDGTTIEGVLHKPTDYDPNKKYPLLVMIHGGPTGVDRPSPVLTYVYPVNQWLNKGALVLRVNYRGSAGYGEKFRSLNVRNLGVGDAWDVLSGVDYLIAKGMVDETRMGCMGWSQGGYISAFLTTNTDKFKAISVGAGISDWMTYYVNTDIHPFTRQYLKATPWNDPEIYAVTSPITNIKNASTPTLIQHGENDQRVPIPNAYELYQGLQDVGVPAKLVVYKGFGHGITRPKERLAAVWHNWQWFLNYVWGEEVEIPVKEEKK